MWFYTFIRTKLRSLVLEREVRARAREPRSIFARFDDGTPAVAAGISELHANAAVMARVRRGRRMPFF